MNKNNILVVGKYYPPYLGGIEHVTRLCCEVLAKSNNVEAIVNSHNDHFGTELLNGVVVTTLRTSLKFSSQPISLALPAKLSIKGRDLVHFHGPNPYAAVILAFKLFFARQKPKLVITHHMDIFGRKFLKCITKPFYNYLFQTAEFTIVTSIKNYQISNDIPLGTPVEVVPLSIDPLQYDISPASREEALLWRRDNFGTSNLIGYVGRHARYKGLDTLIRAVSKVPDLHLVLAGDGDYRDSLISLAKTQGVAERIHFPGAVSTKDKSRLLMAIDVFAFPSTEITEAFGISQLEAMHHGAAVVASNLPTGVTDVAIDGETALLFEPGDEDQLIALLKTVCSDATLRGKLSKAGAAHVQQNFLDAVVAKKFGQIIDKAIALTADAR